MRRTRRKQVEDDHRHQEDVDLAEIRSISRGCHGQVGQPRVVSCVINRATTTAGATPANVRMTLLFAGDSLP